MAIVSLSFKLLAKVNFTLCPIIATVETVIAPLTLPLITKLLVAGTLLEFNSSLKARVSSLFFPTAFESEGGVKSAKYIFEILPLLLPVIKISLSLSPFKSAIATEP